MTRLAFPAALFLALPAAAGAQQPEGIGVFTLSQNGILSWKAPLDPDPAGPGPAEGYIVRWSTGVAITEDTWDDFPTQQLTAYLPLPAAPGTQQSMPVTGLQAGIYYFAIRSTDSEGLISKVSANAFGPFAGDTTPPEPPSGLTVGAADSSTITVTWNPATDDGISIQLEFQPQAGGSATITPWIPVLPASVSVELPPSTAFSIRGRMRDAAGNQSAQTDPPISGATLAAAPPPVAAPSGGDGGGGGCAAGPGASALGLAAVLAGFLPRFRRRMAALGILLLAPAAAFAQEPETIVDLEFREINTLAWKAPGDPDADGEIGPAESYDIRWSTDGDITEDTWESLVDQQITQGVPLPGDPGFPETFVITGLPAGIYTIAIRSSDDEGKTSGVSNTVVALIVAGDTTPPLPVDGLAVSDAGTTHLTLDWLPPSDDGIELQLELQPSAGGPATTTAWLPATSPGHTVPDLPPGTQYSIRGRMRDAAQNESALSNPPALGTTASLGTAGPAATGKGSDGGACSTRGDDSETGLLALLAAVAGFRFRRGAWRRLLPVTVKETARLF